MFDKKIHQRIHILTFIIFLCFTFILGKVFYIEVIDNKKLATLSSSLWERNLPIEANRGKITDRNGVILADNETTVSLIVIPNQIKDKEICAKKLSEILNTDYKDMLRHVSKKTVMERIHPEGRRLSFEVADKISALKLEGVYLVKEAKRTYPYDTLLSSSLGFVGIDNQGLSGLELIYDKYLTGSNGAIKFVADAKGKRLEKYESYIKAQDGINISLTVNYELQKVVERELDNAVLKYQPDQALAIAMDPNTGEVLALSSRPNFSPSSYQNYSIEEINRNLPIFLTYEPGSTFKIITLSTALEENLIDLEKDTYFDTGSVQIENARIKCWKKGGHGLQSYLNIVENSCNTGFVQIGNKIGKEKLFSYIKKFGFGSKTGIDLNGEASGILFPLSKVGPVELATTSFGQGVSVTPIQQIVAVSAAINGGYLYEPYILKSMSEPETNTPIVTKEKKLKRQVIKESTSKKVREALESVVTNGTGRPAFIEGYRVGGKTGTAQKVKDGRYLVGDYIVSFIGFLPANDPKIILYVALDHAKGVTQYGGTVAAPIARDILLSSIDILKIEKPMGASEKKYTYLDKKYIELPNVVGLSLKEATLLLKDFTIEYSGKGEKVIYQSPSAKEKIEEGSRVRLLMG